MELARYDKDIYEEGQTQLRYWLKLNPKRVRAWLWLADMRLSAGYTPLENVRHGVAMALQLDPTNVETHLIRARFQMSGVNPLEALETLKKIPTDRLNTLVGLQTLAMAYLKCGMPEDAEKIIPRMEAIRKDDLTTMMLRGGVAIDLEKPEEAEKWFLRCVDMDKHSLEALESYGAALRVQGKNKELEHCEDALRLVFEKWKVVSALEQQLARSREKNPDLYCKIGQAYLNVSRDKGGLHWLHKALALDPDHAESHEALAKYYRAKNEKEMAEEHERHLKKK